MADEHIEYAPNDWRNPHTRAALDAFNKRAERIQTKYIKLMAEHISELGRLTPSDITRLDQMRRLSANMNEIQKDIAKFADISDDELKDIFENTCKAEKNSFLSHVMDKGNGIDWEGNEELKTAMQAQIRVTQNQLKNFSNTRANSQPYVKAVDSAITEVKTGLTDHSSVIRNAIRQCAAQGLSVVQYETKYKDGVPRAYTRRLDSAVRQNVLDGIRDLNQESKNIVGRQIGCDGVEISAHRLCAKDHINWQGKQMYRFQFDKIQAGLRRPFGMWNCRHWWNPIIMGISKPTYTKEQLESFQDFSNKPITIETDDGVEITKSRYEWTQEQRRLETAVRQQRDIITAAKAENPVDVDTVREATNRIKNYQDAYNKISNGAGIQTEFGRMNTYGKDDPSRLQAQTSVKDDSHTLVMYSNGQAVQVLNSDTSIAVTNIDEASEVVETYEEKVAHIKEKYQKLKEEAYSIRRERSKVFREYRLSGTVNGKVVTADKYKEYYERLGTDVDNKFEEFMKMEELSEKDYTYMDALYKSNLREQIETYVEGSELKFELRQVDLNKLDKEYSDDELVGKLSGGDLTEGSCASLSYAWAGIRGGYDVHDFRGGESRLIFRQGGALNDIINLPKVEAQIIENHDEVSAGARILENASAGKEYILSNGSHASVVRRTEEGVLQYLELQSGVESKNGWTDFIKRSKSDPSRILETVESTLELRFHAERSRTIDGELFEARTVLIDIDSLKDNPEFHKLLRYINTEPELQRKGADGTIK